MSTTEIIGQGGVASGSTMIMASPEHTTQILGLIAQVIALVILFLNRKNGNNAKQP